MSNRRHDSKAKRKLLADLLAGKAKIPKKQKITGMWFYDAVTKLYNGPNGQTLTKEELDKLSVDDDETTGAQTITGMRIGNIDAPIILEPGEGCMSLEESAAMIERELAEIESKKPKGIIEKVKNAVSDFIHPKTKETNDDRRIRLNREWNARKKEPEPLPASPELCIAGWEPNEELQSQIINSENLFKHLNIQNGVQKY